MSGKNGDTEPNTPKPGSYAVLAKIVERLERQPFLLYSISGLVALMSSFWFRADRVGPFVPLLYVVIVMPIAMQFYLEIVRFRAETERERIVAGGLGTAEGRITSFRSRMRAAWDSLVEAVMAFVGIVVFVAVLGAVLGRCDPSTPSSVPEPKSSAESQLELPSSPPPKEP